LTVSLDVQCSFCLLQGFLDLTFLIAQDQPVVQSAGLIFGFWIALDFLKESDDLAVLVLLDLDDTSLLSIRLQR
jgi:hypothetical protein